MKVPGIDDISHNRRWCTFFVSASFQHKECEIGKHQVGFQAVRWQGSCNYCGTSISGPALPEIGNLSASYNSRQSVDTSERVNLIYGCFDKYFDIVNQSFVRKTYAVSSVHCIMWRFAVLSDWALQHHKYSQKNIFLHNCIRLHNKYHFMALKHHSYFLASYGCKD